MYGFQVRGSRMAAAATTASSQRTYCGLKTLFVTRMTSSRVTPVRATPRGPASRRMSRQWARKTAASPIANATVASVASCSTPGPVISQAP